LLPEASRQNPRRVDEMMRSSPKAVSRGLGIATTPQK
jgi:hypothetical protein